MDLLIISIDLVFLVVQSNKVILQFVYSIVFISFRSTDVFINTQKIRLANPTCFINRIYNNLSRVAEYLLNFI